MRIYREKHTRVICIAREAEQLPKTLLKSPLNTGQLAEVDVEHVDCLVDFHLKRKERERRPEEGVECGDVGEDLEQTVLHYSYSGKLPAGILQACLPHCGQGSLGGKTNTVSRSALSETHLNAFVLLTKSLVHLLRLPEVLQDFCKLRIYLLAKRNALVDRDHSCGLLGNYELHNAQIRQAQHWAS